MPKRRISVVIADDNDMMRSILRGMLRGEEYDVIGEASNGVAAVDLVGRLKPDVVCMDVVMPEKNGIEALCEIKASQPTVEVIMVTSNSDPETVQESIQNGACGFIIKPFNSARVLDTLEKIGARLRQKKNLEIVPPATDRRKDGDRLPSRGPLAQCCCDNRRLLATQEGIGRLFLGQGAWHAGQARGTQFGNPCNTRLQCRVLRFDRHGETQVHLRVFVSAVNPRRIRQGGDAGE